MKDYIKINRDFVDRRANGGWRWAEAISAQDYEKACRGEYDLYLTPTKSVPFSWLKDVAGKKVLGLAAGGGQQIPILTALGATCTVLDFSEEMLQRDRLVAEREGYAVETVCADMTDPLPFEDETFDLIVHPVSNCYIPEVAPLWRECYRILKPKGAILSGQDNGMNYILDIDERVLTHKLPFNPLSNEAQRRELEEENSGMQFSHTAVEHIAT